ncbi:MAG: PKD domain-containing protein [Bacteroidota bacterium]
MNNCVKNLTFWAVLLLVILFSGDITAQFTNCDPNAPKVRYRSRNFVSGTPTVITDVPYGGDNIQKMDIYLPPPSDTETNRPVAVWAHPGGFINGAKDTDSAVLWGQEMAKMGYVAVSIAYRKRMLINILTTGPAQGIGGKGGAVRAVYMGLQDGRSAVRYLKANAATYGIDPTKVFFAGSSAGGIIASYIAYMEDAERPSVTKGNFFPFRSNLGCVDCGEFANEDNSTWNGDIVAGMMSWGGVDDYEDGDGILDLIDDANDSDGDGQIDTERMLFMHGSDDDVILPGKGAPFTTFDQVTSLVMPDLYGTYRIRERLASMGANAPHWEAHVLCAEKHEFMLDDQNGGNGSYGLQGTPDETMNYWLQEAVDHFYHALDPTMQETGSIETIVDNGAGVTLNACDSSSKATYAPNAYSTYRVSNPNAGSKYCWDVTKGMILSGQDTPEITVRWSDAPNDDDTANDAIGRSGTVLCFEKVTIGGVETVHKASHHLTLITDGPSTAPDADFVSAVGTNPGQINFADISTNANHPTETYEWDFGDGSAPIVGTMATPSHTYAAVGTYTVTLKAMNDCGNRSDIEKTVTVPGITVSPKAYLQGAFDGTAMNGGLDATNLLPSTEPYTALGFAALENANTGLAASFVPGTGGDAIVDWVVVELRTASATNVVAHSRAALLQKDGDVVDIDGISPVGFLQAAAGMYHVVVRHRNHLGIMTATPINLN